MRSVFEQGEFSAYSNIRLDGSRGMIYKSSQYKPRRTTVFISHKHDDLEDLKGIIGMLESEFGVEVYIDSRDPSMPQVTSAETGENIKKRIRQCDKFILLATNGAIESKWCNWELGYGDAIKYKDHIALFQMAPKHGTYIGSEYMALYPYIARYNGTEVYNTGKPVSKGLYVCVNDGDGGRTITPLGTWFASR